MARRMKSKSEINHIAVLVISILGIVAIISTAFSGLLIHEAVVSDNQIDASSVALIGQMVGIAMLTNGGLIAMLTSTAPKPPTPPTVTDSTTGAVSTPVTVINPPEAPVPTDPVPEHEQDEEVPYDPEGDAAP